MPIDFNLINPSTFLNNDDDDGDNNNNDNDNKYNGMLRSAAASFHYSTPCNDIWIPLFS